MQQQLRDTIDRCAQRGGIEQVLPFARQQRQELIHLLLEALVQHLVRFVQNEHAHFRQVYGLRVEQVQQAARRGDQHLHTLHADHLRIDGNTAEHRHRLDPFRQVRCEFSEDRFHLKRKLARGYQHQHRHVAVGRGPAPFQQPLKDGQGIAQRFPRPGIGDA